MYIARTEYNVTEIRTPVYCRVEGGEGMMGRKSITCVHEYTAYPVHGWACHASCPSPFSAACSSGLFHSVVGFACLP